MFLLLLGDSHAPNSLDFVMTAAYTMIVPRWLQSLAVYGTVPSGPPMDGTSWCYVLFLELSENKILALFSPIFLNFGKKRQLLVILYLVVLTRALKKKQEKIPTRT